MIDYSATGYAYAVQDERSPDERGSIAVEHLDGGCARFRELPTVTGGTYLLVEIPAFGIHVLHDLPGLFAALGDIQPARLDELLLLLHGLGIPSYGDREAEAFVQASG